MRRPYASLVIGFLIDVVMASNAGRLSSFGSIKGDTTMFCVTVNATNPRLSMWLDDCGHESFGVVATRTLRFHLASQGMTAST